MKTSDYKRLKSTLDTMGYDVSGIPDSFADIAKIAKRMDEDGCVKRWLN